MSKFAKWASRTNRSHAKPQQQAPAQKPRTQPVKQAPVQAQAPSPIVNPHNGQPVNMPQQVYQPPGMPQMVPVNRPSVPVHPNQAPVSPNIRRQHSTNQVVKEGNYDGYAMFLAQTPELTGPVLPDMSDGFDALEARGRPPEGATMKDWKPTAKPHVGVPETQARGDVEQRLSQRYQDSVMSIRSSQGSNVGVQPSAPILTPSGK